MKKSYIIVILILCVLIASGVFYHEAIQKNAKIHTYALSGVVILERNSELNQILEVKISQDGCFYTVFRIGKGTKFFLNNKEFSIEDSLEVKKINFKYKKVEVGIYFPSESKFGTLGEVRIKD